MCYYPSLLTEMNTLKKAWTEKKGFKWDWRSGGKKPISFFLAKPSPSLTLITRETCIPRHTIFCSIHPGEEVPASPVSVWGSEGDQQDPDSEKQCYNIKDLSPQGQEHSRQMAFPSKVCFAETGNTNTHINIMYICISLYAYRSLYALYSLCYRNIDIFICSWVIMASWRSMIMQSYNSSTYKNLTIWPLSSLLCSGGIHFLPPALCLHWIWQLSSWASLPFGPFAQSRS